MEQYRGTTILSVRRNGKVVIGGDGQVSMGNTIMKGNARKVRRLHSGQVIAGFAGGTADAFTLFERFETNWNSTTAISPKQRSNSPKIGVPIACCASLRRCLRSPTAKPH